MRRLGIMCQDFCGALCLVSIRGSRTHESGFLDLVQPVWSPPGHTSPTPFHDHPAQLPLTLLEAVATAARGTSAPRVASTHGPSIRSPSPAFGDATPWPSHDRWWARTAVAPGVKRCGGGRSY